MHGVESELNNVKTSIEQETNALVDALLKYKLN